MRPCAVVAPLLLIVSLTLGACAHRSVVARTEGEQLSREMAEVLVAHHADEQATPILQQALAHDPNDARMRLLMGMVLRDRGLFAQSEQELLRVHAQLPGDADTLAALGVLYDRWGRHEQAEPYHRRAIAARPRAADGYNNLGFSLYLRGHYDAAVAAYNEALRRDPNARRVYNNLGFAHARCGRFAAAQQAFENGGGRAAALANLGLAYELDGDLMAAQHSYEQALRLDRSLEAARKNLAHLQARQKDLLEAGPKLR